MYLALNKGTYANPSLCSSLNYLFSGLWKLNTETCLEKRASLIQWFEIANRTDNGSYLGNRESV